MAIDRIVPSLMIAIGVTAALQHAAFAEDRGTLDQQMACTPDVWRLCSTQIPDTNRIVGCLRQNMLQLSAPCGVRVQQHHVASPRTARPHGAAASRRR